MPILPKRHGNRSRDLYDEICARIADGTFAAGAALPSTRTLAAERGLARTTVTGVYEQLTADGFIESRPGAASRVIAGTGNKRQHARLSSRRNMSGWAKVSVERLSTIGQRLTVMDSRHVQPTAAGEIDFVYGPLAGTDFPSLAWGKALRAVERHRKSRLEYEDPRGNLELRQVLQTHLSQTRGLVCSVEQVMIVNGSQQALDLCARLLVNPGDCVAVENPGYQAAHQTFLAYGAELACIEVDSQGLKTDQLAALGQAKLVYVTPTHQFPLGSFLPMARRSQLLSWAEQQNAWVIEDDYDSEYRFSVRPEPTLQSLDTADCVIHVGTFSKTLSPQLRLGYMVLPNSLVEVFTRAKRLSDRHAPTGVQRALAMILSNGSYGRHLRRIRRLQQGRQRALIDALTTHLGEEVEIQGAASGLHVVVRFRKLPAKAEDALVYAARAQGVCVYPLSPLFQSDTPRPLDQRHAGLVMGYALLEEKMIWKGVKSLANAFRQVTTKILTS